MIRNTKQLIQKAERALNILGFDAFFPVNTNEENLTVSYAAHNTAATPRTITMITLKAETSERSLRCDENLHVQYQFSFPYPKEVTRNQTA